MIKRIEKPTPKGIDESIRSALALTHDELMTAAPSEIVGDRLALAAFVVTSLRKLVSKRYDELRRHLVDLAAADGQQSDNGRVFLRVGAWEVRFSTRGVRAPVERVVAVLAGIGGDWYSRVIKQREASQTKCDRCGGHGYTWVPSGPEVDEAALKEAIDAGVVRYEDVYEATYTLGQIRPPVMVAARLKGLTSTSGGDEG